MNILEEQLNDKIRGAFFDLLTFNEEQADFNETLYRLVSYLKKEMNLKDATLYLYYQWSNCFIPEASTIEIVRTQPDLFFVSKENIKNEWLETQIISNYSFILNQENFQTFILFLYHSDRLMGALEIEFHHHAVPCSMEFLKKVRQNSAALLQRAHVYTKVFNEDKRYEQLFRVTAKFHSSMNMDDVLTDIIHTLKMVFPSFTYYLLLSHDNSNRNNLPIKVLQYDSDSQNIAAIQSYVTGTVQIEDSLVEKKSIFYAPLKGKQGVYGVLQVISPQNITFPDDEINFISLLANTAGGAIENAQLYQQSKRLINDLQLINETSHQLNSNLRLNEVMAFMTNQMINSFNAEEVGFILFESNKTTPLPGSTAFFLENEAKKYIHIVVSKILTDKDSLFIGDLATDYHFKEPKFRSLMAVPMVHSGNLKGVAIVLHHEPYFFSFETFKLLQSLIHHSTLAFTNSMLREELEKLVITDYLTKLYSRNYLDEKIKLSMKHDSFGTFILIDIDDFKQINDTYGHQIGDEMIILVAGYIKSSIRDKDIGARWGGEELAIYLPKVDLEIGKHIAERIVKKVEEETNPKITISCGISFWRLDYKESMDSLFKRADKALYIAKSSGKNRVVVDYNYIGL